MKITLLNTLHVLRLLFDGDNCDTSDVIVIVTLSASDAEPVTFNVLDTINVDLCYEMAAINDLLDGIGSIYCVNDASELLLHKISTMFFIYFRFYSRCGDVQKGIFIGTIKLDDTRYKMV